MAWPNTVAEQLRKQHWATAVAEEPSSQAPPESLALQERKDEALIAISPVELNQIAPPFVAETPSKTQPTMAKQDAFESNCSRQYPPTESQSAERTAGQAKRISAAVITFVDLQNLIGDRMSHIF
jgi:hypothetical protein